MKLYATTKSQSQERKEDISNSLNDTFLNAQAEHEGQSQMPRENSTAERISSLSWTAVEINSPSSSHTNLQSKRTSFMTGVLWMTCANEGTKNSDEATVVPMRCSYWAKRSWRDNKRACLSTQNPVLIVCNLLYLISLRRKIKDKSWPE